MKTANKKVAENHSSMRQNIYIMPVGATTIYRMQKMVSPAVGVQLGINPRADGVYMFCRTLGTRNIKRARRNRDLLLDWISGLHGKEGNRAMPRFNNPDRLTGLITRSTNLIKEEREQKHNLGTLRRMITSLKDETVRLSRKRKEAEERVVEWEELK